MTFKPKTHLKVTIIAVKALYTYRILHIQPRVQGLQQRKEHATNTEMRTLLVESITAILPGTEIGDVQCRASVVLIPWTNSSKKNQNL